jgi:hypothetical protein
MYLELVDEDFKKAVRDEVAKVITRDTQNENKEMVKEIMQNALKEMWSTSYPEFQKAFKNAMDNSYSFKDNVVDAIKKNAQPLIAVVDSDSIISKYITDEIVGKAVTAKVEKILETSASNKRIEEIIEKKVQEIFIRKFMLQEIMPKPKE